LEEENAAHQVAQAAALEEYNRNFPAPDPAEVIRRNEERAAQGAALLLGMPIVSNMDRPATGPGSILCDKYRLGVKGNDASACWSPAK
jgi:hypothetical protein